MRISVLIILSFTALLCSCSVEPDPIEYGFDHCNFCEMTVVDKSHAAVVVSSKGKTYKFDAIECMIHFYNRSDDMKFSKFLVCDYTNPGNLITAEGSHFLISEGIPSPMGGFLSAISDKQVALDLQSEKGGELFQWDEVLTKFQ
jgi:copper chaperone NosL